MTSRTSPHDFHSPSTLTGLGWFHGVMHGIEGSVHLWLCSSMDDGDLSYFASVLTSAGQPGAVHVSAMCPDGEWASESFYTTEEAKQWAEAKVADTLLRSMG